MSYFKKSLSEENKQMIEMLKIVADDCDIASTMREIKPYIGKKPEDFQLGNAETGYINIELDGRQVTITMPSAKWERIQSKFNIIVEKTAILFMQWLFLKGAKIAINKFMMGKIKKTASNKAFVDYIKSQKEKIESKHPDWNPCTIDDFKKADFFEKLASNFREKNAKETAKFLARVTISKSTDVYYILVGSPVKVPVPGLGELLVNTNFKYRLQVAILRILNALLKNKDGLFDQDMANAASLSNYDVALFFGAVKTVLGRWGINFGLVSLYSRLCSFNGQAMMVRMDMTPKGFRMNNLELFYYNYYEKGPKIPKNRRFVRKSIPDPPESVYKITMVDVKREVSKLKSLNTSKELDKYAKGLLKDADEI